MLSLIATLQTLGFQLMNRLENEKGATAVEYALLVALIGAALVTVMGTLTGEIGKAFNLVSSAIPG